MDTKFSHVLCIIFLILPLSCRTWAPQETESVTVGLGKPTAEGVPISFRSNLPARVGHEIFKNLEFLAEASTPDSKLVNMRPLDFEIICESASSQEHRCRLTYTGPEIKLKLAEFLFRSMAGSVYVRRGCKDRNCETPPLQLWWRAVHRHGDGFPQEFDFEICDIRGLEAGIGVQMPFAFGMEFLEKVSYRPEILGFKATIASSFTEVVKTDDDGQPTAAAGPPQHERVESFVGKSLGAGLGPLGGFPNNHCWLDEDRKRLGFKLHPQKKEWTLPVSAQMLESVPANFIKFLFDATRHLAKASCGQKMAVTLRCQNVPLRSVCEIRYQGPQLTLPIPRYMTGIFNAEIVFLRDGKNLGTKKRKEAVIQLAAYREDHFETIEMCSASGIEIQNVRKFPLQNRLFGAPDIKGMILRFDPKVLASGGVSQDPRQEPPSVLKTFHMGLGIKGLGGRYPTNRCEFYQN